MGAAVVVVGGGEVALELRCACKALGRLGAESSVAFAEQVQLVELLDEMRVLRGGLRLLCVLLALL